MKTVHGPEAHITKKHRGDTGPRPHGAAMTAGVPNSELLLEKEETRREDCKLLAPETTLVSNFRFFWGMAKHRTCIFADVNFILSCFRNPSQVLVVSHPAVVNVLHWEAPTTMTAVLR